MNGSDTSGNNNNNINDIRTPDLDQLSALDADDINKILHPNELFTNDDDIQQSLSDNGNDFLSGSLNGNDKNGKNSNNNNTANPDVAKSTTSSSVIEDIINPSLDPHSILSPMNDNNNSNNNVLATTRNLTQEPVRDLIRRTTSPMGIYHPSLNTVTQPTQVNELLSSQILANTLAQQQQLPKAPSKRYNAHKTRPAFVNKLWSMVNDEANHPLIQWSDDGKSFVVTNRGSFVHEILPKYFKHSNFASFVRQLNMYGWHKIQDVKSGSIQSSSDDRWQFGNRFFLRGRDDLLVNIIRQKGGSSTSTAAHNTNNDDGSNVNGGAPFDANSLYGNTINNGRPTLQIMNEAHLGNKLDSTLILNELEQLKYNQLALSKDLILSLIHIYSDNEDQLLLSFNVVRTSSSGITLSLDNGSFSSFVFLLVSSVSFQDNSSLFLVSLMRMVINLENLLIFC